MLFLVQKLLAVMLAVNIQQLGTDLPQLGHSQRPSVDPAGIFAVHRHLPLQQQVSVLIRSYAVFRQSRQICRDMGKHGADKGLGHAGADQFPGGPAPQHGPHGVDDDGFARAGLAGQSVEAGLKGNIRRLYHRDIFNMEQFQHGLFLPRKGSLGS